MLIERGQLSFVFLDPVFGKEIGGYIPYAAMSETSSNRWNLSVISDFSFSA
jgi:mRNA-degrading endonuclease toxin of MazEF toxin-antitoxin module